MYKTYLMCVSSVCTYLAADMLYPANLVPTKLVDNYFKQKIGSLGKLISH